MLLLRETPGRIDARPVGQDCCGVLSQRAPHIRNGPRGREGVVEPEHAHLVRRAAGRDPTCGQLVGGQPSAVRDRVADVRTLRERGVDDDQDRSLFFRSARTATRRDEGEDNDNRRRRAHDGRV
jgi:hypothetical protein